MPRIKVSLPSPAGAISVIALFVALGGTGYAASKLVGPRATSAAAKATKKYVNKKVQASLTADAASDANASVKHASTADTATSATNAANASSIADNAVSTSKIADNAVNGAKVADGSLTAADISTATLPFPNPPKSGTTLRGTFAVRGTASVAGDSVQEGQSFGFTLPSAPTVHFINFGSAVPAGCTGGTPANPTAAPGNLCIYEAIAPINSTTRREFDPSNSSGGGDGVALPYGFGIQADSDAAGDFRVRGTWAVTAP